MIERGFQLALLFRFAHFSCYPALFLEIAQYIVEIEIIFHRHTSERI